MTHGRLTDVSLLVLTSIYHVVVRRRVQRPLRCRVADSTATAAAVSVGYAVEAVEG